MNTLISPNHPRPLLPPSHPLGTGISAIKPLHLSSSSKCSSRKLYAGGRSRGFSGPSNQEVGPTKAPPDDEEEELSPVVINRMIGRILVYVGLPMAAGLGMLQVYAFLREKQIWDVPLWISFLTSFVAFGSSALGVPYGALSTSWDPDKEGSLLGFDEASHNWVQMWREDSN